jgi:hypothetical protein
MATFPRHIWIECMKGAASLHIDMYDEVETDHWGHERGGLGDPVRGHQYPIGLAALGRYHEPHPRQAT